MSFSPVAAVGTLVFTFVNFLTYLSLWLSSVDQSEKTKGLNGVVTQMIAWIAGIAVMLIAAHTQLASSITFGSMKLANMDWQTQVFLGLIATSILSTVNEVKKAIDNGDSAVKIPLIGKTAALDHP